ncbi:MAG: hypothetical protein IPK64_11475 [bacterium]|nr:hypothetical protein [bacterium]
MTIRPANPATWRAARCLAGACLALTAAVAAPAAPPPIPVAEIRAGMTGYGLTVFAGSRIDTFSVRVLGVQENARAQGSLVLVEVGGHGLERSSIAQGMSGSPVYLDGRFAGAVAFGWEGALSPIGGVTPAEEMLALPTSAAPPPAGPRAGGDWDPRRLVCGRGHELAMTLFGAGAVPAAAAAPTRDLVAGWPAPLDLAADLLEPLLPRGGAGAPAWLVRPAGMATASAAVGNIPAEEPARLRPGSACAVTLVGGDADLGAIGTVTWVDGDRVLMMGHPLLQRGAVNLPLAAADIVTILPSRRLSFKLGSPGPVVGAVHHDLRAGLAGRLGAVAPTVPVEVRLNGAAPGTFRFTVADDPQLTPLLVFWSFYNALLAGGDDASRQLLDWRLLTTWRDRTAGAPRQLALGGVASGPGGAGTLAGEVMTPLGLLLDNPFGTLALESAVFTVDVKPGRADAVVMALGAPRHVAAGAAMLPVTVELRDNDGGRRQVPFEIPLPTALPAGTYRLVAASAAEFFAFEAQRAPDRLRPERLEDLWELLATERSASTLVVALFSPDRPAIVGGRELAAVPGSVARAIDAGRQPPAQALARYAARASLATDWALAGNAVRTLEVAPAVPARSNARRP